MRKVLLIILFILPFGLNAQLNTDRLTSIGRSALYFEDYVLSIQYFNQVIKAKPFLSEAYFYRAIAKIQLEDYVGAEQDLNRVIELNPFVTMAYYARGFARRRLLNFEGASSDFTTALKYSPENQLFIINRVEVYEQLKLFDESIVDVDFLIKRSPYDVRYYFEKGRLLMSKGDTIQAKPYFYKGVELDSANSEMWVAKAYYQMVVKQNDSALSTYNKAVDLGSKNISTYINRGILNYYNKNYRSALSDYDMAVTLDPYNISALYNRALLRSEVGDYNTALVDLDNIIKLEPESPEALYQSAVIHTELKQWNKAVVVLSKLIEQHKYFAPGLFMRANAYEKMGKEKLAFLDREAAYNLEKEYKNKSTVDTINTNVQVANNYKSSISKKSSIFLAKVNEDNTGNGKQIRGAIQNNDVQLTSEQDYQISYYYLKSSGDISQRFHINTIIQSFNNSKRLNAPIYIVNKEVQLSSALINHHFSSIENYTTAIEQQPTNGDLYFARAMDFVVVKDFTNALNDFSKAIFYGENMALAYFMRANVRYKSIEASLSKLDIEENIYMSALGDASNKKTNDKNISLFSSDKRYAMEYEMVMRDYDKTIELAPNFPYAWFNKANLLGIQRDYFVSIAHYSKAIEIYPDFGEAYFNRALVYILLDRIDNAILDLSKAGELGIFQSYSIIKRLKDTSS